MYLLTVLQAGRSLVNVPAGLVSAESFLPGLQTALFALCPDTAEREREVFSVISLLKMALISFLRAPASHPNHLSKPPPPNTTALGGRLHHIKFGGGGGTQTFNPWQTPSSWSTRFLERKKQLFIKHLLGTMHVSRPFHHFIGTQRTEEPKRLRPH